MLLQIASIQVTERQSEGWYMTTLTLNATHETQRNSLIFQVISAERIFFHSERIACRCESSFVLIV